MYTDRLKLREALVAAMRNRFVELLEKILEPVCPRAGLAYLLRAHPSGCYFPVALLENQQPVALTFDAGGRGIPYYLLPYWLPAGDLPVKVLDAQTPALDVAASGRLEACYLEPPVWQSFYRSADPGSPPVVLVIAYGDRYTLKDSTSRLRPVPGLAGRTIDLWAEYESRSLALSSAGTLDEIASAFCRLVDGNSLQPVWDCVLDLHLELECNGQSKRLTVMNPAGYNGLLSDPANRAADSPAARAVCGREFRRAVPLDSGDTVFAEHLSPHQQSPLEAGTLRSLSPWQAVRAGLRYLGEPARLKTDSFASVWLRAQGAAHFLAIRPGAEVPLPPPAIPAATSVSFDAGWFLSPRNDTGTARERLNGLASQAALLAAGLDPAASCRAAWLEAARRIELLMSRELHDVYAGRGWETGLPERYDEVERLASESVQAISRVFAWEAGDFRPIRQGDYSACVPLHVLWCLRKFVVHPSLIAWLAGKPPDAFAGAVRFFFDPGENERPLPWSIELLRRVAELRHSGGLRDVALAATADELVTTFTFEIASPDKWVPAVLSDDAPEDGGVHAMRRAFSFFRASGLPVTVERIARKGHGWEAAAEVRFRAREIS